MAQMGREKLLLNLEVSGSHPVTGSSNQHKRQNLNVPKRGQEWFISNLPKPI